MIDARSPDILQNASKLLEPPVLFLLSNSAVRQEKSDHNDKILQIRNGGTGELNDTAKVTNLRRHRVRP